MKRTLLYASSNGLLSKQFTNLLLFTLLFLGALLSANAQCVAPLQKFQSVDTDANMTALGWTRSGFTVVTGANIGKSGIRHYQYAPASTTGAATLPFVQTELLANPSNFSFWVRRTSTVVLGYKVELLFGGTYYDLSNPTDLATLGIAPGDVSLPPLAASATLYNVTVNNIPNTLTNIRFRISDARPLAPATTVIGAVVFDEFTWRSHNAALNTEIVPLIGSAAVCNVNVSNTDELFVFDNGGNHDTYNINQNNNITFTPVDPTAKIKITFLDYFYTETTALTDYLQVYNDDTFTTQVGANYFGNLTPSLPGAITSSNANGTLSIKFISNGNAVGVLLQGFRIKVQAVKCTTPTTLTGNGSVDTATLNWNGTSSNYDVYYSTSNTAPTGATVPQVVNSAGTTATVTGLANSTTYYMWVRSNCGSGEYSPWIGPVTITTICPPTTVTYLENFNGFNLVLPPCTSATSSAWQTNITNGNLFTNAQGSTFFTRGISLNAGQPYRLSYDFSTNGFGNGELSVAYGMTSFAPTQSNITTGIAYHPDFSTIQTNMVTFTPSVSGTYYFGFTLESLSDPANGAMNIDNIKLEEDNCLPPTGLVLNGAITEFGAPLTWTVPTTGAPSNGYEYYVSTVNVAPNFNDLASGTTTTNSLTLNTLSPGTRYYVWVRGNCGGQKSVWITVPITFVTLTSTNVVVEIDNPTSPNTGCNFTFLDSGGATGSYVNDEVYTYTFIPGTAGSKLKAVFGTFNTENNWDGLMIYNGTTVNPANLISSGRPVGNNATTCPAGAFSGTASPGTIISTSADGALTFVFRSDFLITGAGWSANITCVTPPVITDFNPKNNSCGAVPTPTVVITGSNLSGVTSVTFNGVPATSFSIDSPTQISAVFPIAATTGKIVLTNNTASATSTVNFEVQTPGPATTGGSICAGGTGGTIMTNVSCSGFGAPTTTIAGALTAATDPTAPRLETMSNSTACSFVAGSVRNYVAYDFQVSVSGTYTFTMPTVPSFDPMAYITQLGFTAGDCLSGTFIVGDDDSGIGVAPSLSANLVTGVTYTLYTTSWGSTATVSGAYSWTVTPPVGGGVMPFTNSVTQWYAAASGGSPIGTGSPFNPVGVSGSGIPNNLAVGVYTLYAACSTNPNCRTATTFEIKPGPTPTLPANFATCANTATPITVTGTGDTFTWTSTVANTLFSDADGTVPYVPLTSATTVYVKTSGTVTVTVLATSTANGCQRSASVVITTPTATWNGTAWSPSAPNASTAAVFNGNYVATGNLTACSVTVNSGAVSFGVGQTLTVINDVKVLGGSLTMGNESSLLQVNNTTNTGNITYVRASAPVIRYDYSYWSTPVSPQTLAAASPGTSWDGFFSYSGTAWQWAPSSTVMGIGKGYIIRVPLSYSATIPSTQIVNFVGVPNNGTYTVPVVGGASQLNLLGNPYPSALNADLFMNANSSVLDGTIYLWTHNTPITAGQYDADDYAIYNYLGGTGTSASPNPGLNSEIPTGKIASGQGFFIKGLANGTATFTNAMRVAGNNDQFFRMSQPVAASTPAVEKHRYWIDVFNATGIFKQNLFGYVTGGTMGIDRGMDSEMVNLTSPIVLYSKVGDTKLAIQGRGLPFDVNDQIPLAYQSTVAASYTIRLSMFDGLFESQDIYLEDKLLNVIHNLKGGDYTFTTAVGTFEDRFVLRYTNTTLGVDVPVLDENTVIVYRNGKDLIVNSGVVNMSEVMIYDLRGRLLASQQQVNATETVFTTLPDTQQVLLVKIKAENGAEVTKKVVY